MKVIYVGDKLRLHLNSYEKLSSCTDFSNEESLLGSKLPYEWIGGGGEDGAQIFDIG